MKIQDIQSSDIQKIYNICIDKQLSSSTIRHIHTILNQSFEEAINQKLVVFNPTKKTVRPVNRRKEITVLTVKQQEKLLSCLEDDAIGVIIKLAIGTGARLGELLGLEWENIDFEKKEMHIVHGLVKTFAFDIETHKAHYNKLEISKLKTESSLRIIPLTDSLIKTLKKYKRLTKASTGVVFLTSKGQLLYDSNVRRKYKQILEKAGIPYVKFHALRHTFATRILEANVHPKVAQELLGHSSASTTLNIYSHVLSSEKRKAMDKLSLIIPV